MPPAQQTPAVAQKAAQKSAPKPAVSGTTLKLNSLTGNFETLRREFNALGERYAKTEDEMTNLKNEVSELTNKQDKSIKQIGVLKALVQQREAENTALEDRVQFLEKVLRVVEDIDGTEGAEAEEGSEMDDDDNELDYVDKDERERAAKRKTLTRSKPLKDVLGETFRRLIGVEKISARHLPTYPHMIDATHWPVDKATGKPYLRFDFTKSADHPRNVAPLAEVLAHIQVNGVALEPLAKSTIEFLTEKELRKCVRLRFQYMCRAYREHHGLTATVTECVDEQDEEEEEEEEVEGEPEVLEETTDENIDPELLQPQVEPVVQQGVKEAPAKAKKAPKALSRGHHDSHAAAVLAIRNRKHVGSEYADPKYDAAFLLNSMSDYEDDPDQEPTHRKHYIRRQPGYRSDLLVKLYTEIDARIDPNPDKGGLMKPRVDRGDVNKEAEPPVARQLDKRLRRWMIKPELLAENPHWMISKVAENGVLWGDAEDPSDTVNVEEGSEKRKSGKGGGGQRKKRKKNPEISKALEEAGKKLEKVLGDAELGDVFPEEE